MFLRITRTIDDHSDNWNNDFSPPSKKDKFRLKLKKTLVPRSFHSDGLGKFMKLNPEGDNAVRLTVSWSLSQLLYKHQVHYPEHNAKSLQSFPDWPSVCVAKLQQSFRWKRKWPFFKKVRWIPSQRSDIPRMMLLQFVASRKLSHCVVMSQERFLSSNTNWIFDNPVQFSSAKSNLYDRRSCEISQAWFSWSTIHPVELLTGCKHAADGSPKGTFLTTTAAEILL